MLRRTLYIALTFVLAVMSVTACGTSNTVAPPAPHIITAISADSIQTAPHVYVTNPQHIFLDNQSNWCSVADVVVFHSFKLGDVVPAGTCTWYPTT